MTGGARTGIAAKATRVLMTNPMMTPEDDDIKTVVAYRRYLQITVSGPSSPSNKGSARRDTKERMTCDGVHTNNHTDEIYGDMIYEEYTYIYIYMFIYVEDICESFVHGNPGLRVTFHPLHFASVIIGNDK